MKILDRLLGRKPKEEAAKPEVKPEPKPAAQKTITLSLEDSTLVRAEKMIWATGLCGATGDFVYHVAKVLEKYTDMEKAQKKLLELEVEGLRKQVAAYNLKQEEKQAKKKAKKDSKNVGK